MRTCWAKCLGNCSEKISREHPISRAMFGGDEVRVQGFPWCREAPRTISVASLTRKVLCQRHNAELSDLDRAGADARKAFIQTDRVADLHGALPTIGGYHVSLLDGRKFERWCLKTLISISFQGDSPIGRNANGRGEVDNDAVKLAFGLTDFPPRAGLYSIGSVGQDFSCEPHIRIAPFTGSGGYIFGGLFILFNFRFAVTLEDMGHDHIHVMQKSGISVMDRSAVHYRPLKLGIRVGEVDWTFVFDW